LAWTENFFDNYLETEVQDSGSESSENSLNYQNIENEPGPSNRLNQTRANSIPGIKNISKHKFVVWFSTYQNNCGINNSINQYQYIEQNLIENLNQVQNLELELNPLDWIQNYFEPELNCAEVDSDTESEQEINFRGNLVNIIEPVNLREEDIIGQINWVPDRDFYNIESASDSEEEPVVGPSNRYPIVHPANRYPYPIEPYRPGPVRTSRFVRAQPRHNINCSCFHCTL